jgi:hypothetical protein
MGNHKWRLRLAAINQEHAPNCICQACSKSIAQKVEHQVGLGHRRARGMYRAIGTNHTIGIYNAIRHSTLQLRGKPPRGSCTSASE